MQPRNLFTPEQRLAPLEVDPRRAEPVVRLQRFVILKNPNPNSVIRDIPLNRGLNIVRTRRRNRDETRTVAHDVGKALLMRLLRFTLGEDWFASRADMNRIRNSWGHDWVVATVVVQGLPWAPPIAFALPVGFRL